MAALGSQSIASSYEQLLHVDRDGGGNTTNHVSVKDGDNGTTFGFTIASDALMMSSTNRLEFGDNGTYIHQSADGVLDLVSDTEIEINATTVDMNGALDLDGAFTQDAGAVVFNEAGADYDFRVEGDTEQNLLFCDASTDRVGIGTSNPAQELDLVGQFISADNKTNNTDKQAIFLSHQYSITSEPEGFMMMETYSGASDNRIDIGGGNSGYNSATSITFNTGANTTTRTGTERLRIDSSGNVGIGTTSPDDLLHVYKGSAGTVAASTDTQFVIEDDSEAGMSILTPTANIGLIRWGTDGDATRGSIKYFHSAYGTAALRDAMQFSTGNDAAAVTIDSSGNVGIAMTPGGSHKLDVTGSAGLSTGTAWTNTSDERIKTNVETIEGGLDKINALRPVSFNYTEDYLEQHSELSSDKTYNSFIAQEYAEVFPMLLVYAAILKR